MSPVLTPEEAKLEQWGNRTQSCKEERGDFNPASSPCKAHLFTVPCSPRESGGSSHLFRRRAINPGPGESQLVHLLSPSPMPHLDQERMPRVWGPLTIIRLKDGQIRHSWTWYSTVFLYFHLFNWKIVLTSSIYCSQFNNALKVVCPRFERL